MSWKKKYMDDFVLNDMKKRLVYKRKNIRCAKEAVLNRPEGCSLLVVRSIFLRRARYGFVGFVVNIIGLLTE